MPWYDLSGNLAWLGHYLHDEKGYGIIDILYMVEKPWKYNKEWEEYLKYRDDEE
tara:strand:- start:2173 stop:2334 length:162 start_codon:yes stop_codon:yes gene_type:complete